MTKFLNIDSGNREEGTGWLIDQKRGMRRCFQIKLDDGVGGGHLLRQKLQEEK